MGAFINDTTPELVAERLRAVAVPAAPALAPSASASSVPGVTEGASA